VRVPFRVVGIVIIFPILLAEAEGQASRIGARETHEHTVVMRFEYFFSMMPVDESKEAFTKHILGEVLNEFVVGSKEPGKNLPLVGGNHVVSGKVQKVIKYVIDVLLFLGITGDPAEFALDDVSVESLKVTIVLFPNSTAPDFSCLNESLHSTYTSKSSPCVLRT